MPGGNIFLYLLIVHYTAFLHIYKEHSPWLQSSVEFDVFRGDIYHADFRGHNNIAVLGYRIPGWPQAISIQDGPDIIAIGKGDRGRSVPRFHQTGMVFIES